MPKKLIEITSEIVQTQVSLTPMSAVEIASSLRQVFITLHELQKAETAGIDIEFTQPAAGISQEPGLEQKPMLTPENSIQNDKVICLECGKEMRQLTSKHLVFHGMNQKEYRNKYGFAMRTPLSAKSLTKARSKAAKKRGLPDKFRQYLEARKQGKAAASTKAATETVTPGKPERTRLRKKNAV
jgi:predicted transcriptional regulator